jgi:hypothetical protein
MTIGVIEDHRSLTRAVYNGLQNRDQEGAVSTPLSEGD